MKYSTQTRARKRLITVKKKGGGGMGNGLGWGVENKMDGGLMVYIPKIQQLTYQNTILSETILNHYYKISKLMQKLFLFSVWKRWKTNNKYSNEQNATQILEWREIRVYKNKSKLVKYFKEQTPDKGNSEGGYGKQWDSQTLRCKSYWHNLHQLGMRRGSGVRGGGDQPIF